MKSTDRTVSQGGIQGEISQADKVVSAEHEEDEDEDEAINVIEEQASFDKVVLWGHESTPDGNDPYAKGIEEWISFAETVSIVCWRDARHGILMVLIDAFNNRSDA